ncbi:MAG: tryptophan-rich sensory protein [Bryobacteraceae bacterium]
MWTRRYRWWHGVAFYAGVQAASFSLKWIAGAVAKRRKPVSSGEDRAFYRAERLPVFAPPTVAFPIAWSINSAAAIAGGLHVLNLPRRTRGRDEFLQWQAAAWILYSSFQAAYFGLRSPINAAAVTVLYSAATAASLDAAIRRMRDSRAAWSLAPTVAWLALANPLGITQALWNRDPFWSAGPFAEPKAEWVKSMPKEEQRELKLTPAR